MLLSLLLATSVAAALPAERVVSQSERHRFERIAAKSNACSLDREGGMTCVDKNNQFVGYLPAPVLVDAEFTEERIIFFWEKKK